MRRAAAPGQLQVLVAGIDNGVSANDDTAAYALANEVIFTIADDSDATLTAIRESILAYAPSVERMVNIPLTKDGARQATDKEIVSAIAEAEDLAKKHFGVALREAK